MHIFSVFFYYLQATLYFWFGIKKTEKMYNAGYCLWSKSSFRLPRNAGYDRLIGLKTLFRSMKILWKNNLPEKKLASEPSAIIDYSSKNEILHFELKKLNVEQLTKKTLGYFILKNHIMPNTTIAGKIFWAILMASYSVPIIVLTFFLSPKYRANAALIITEIIETIHLASMLKKNSIKTVYDFHPYEIDSNICAIILINAGIRVVKMPSPGPLAIHNDILIADAIVTSTPYHQDEIKHFKKTIFVNEIIPWIPERALTYIDRYKGKKLMPPQYTIGFYSHASWVREMEGHIDDGMHVADAEHMMLEALKKFLEKNRHVRLVIFPHPREKAVELVSRTRERYEKVLKGLPYSIFFSEDPASHVFNEADLGIVSFSTIVYERLFCGYKTLLVSFNNSNFPIAGSALGNICITNQEELIAKIESSLSISTEEFFKINNIAGYTFDNFSIN